MKFRDIEKGVAQALIQSTYNVRTIIQSRNERNSIKYTIKKRTIIGSPSEAAMLRYCDQMFSVATVRKRHTVSKHLS